MKGSNDFKAIIKMHLDEVASKDKLFAETLKKENKNFDDCITYILNQVKESGMCGFGNDEIYQMAMHYYDEDNIKVGSKLNCRVVVNEEVKLTAAEIADAKQQAIDREVEAQRLKIKNQRINKAKKAEKKEEGQMSLSL